MTDQSPPTAHRAGRRPVAAGLWAAGAAVLLPAGLALGWQGAGPALVGGLLCAGAGWCGLRWHTSRRAHAADAGFSASPPATSALAQASTDQAFVQGQAGVSTPAERPAAAARRTGAEQPRGGVNPMIVEIVPVWSRQLDSTRSTADTGLNSVLNAFAEMNGSVDTLVTQLEGMSTSAQPGAVDAAVGESAAPLGALLGPSLRAFEQRDAAISELEHCAQALVEMAQLARQAKEIGRHTRLVAFNASIEASRNHQAQDGGNEAVAHEMRQLSTRMGECGAALHRAVTGLQQRLDTLRERSITERTTEEELRLEIELRAREALQALMSAVGASLSTSGSVREAMAALRQNLDDAFVHFQFGDRISQMLSILCNDMNNFVDWNQRNPAPNLDDATEWLKRLEASYTMEEQRSEHHGNVHVDRGSEVEFF